MVSLWRWLWRVKSNRGHQAQRSESRRNRSNTRLTKINQGWHRVPQSDTQISSCLQVIHIKNTKSWKRYQKNVLESTEYSSTITHYDIITVWKMWKYASFMRHQRIKWQFYIILKSIVVVLDHTHFIALCEISVCWSRLPRYVISTNVRGFVLQVPHTAIWPK